MKTRRFLLLVAVLAVTLVACSYRTQNNLSKVTRTMTETQVVQLIGIPDTIDTASIAGLVASTYRYEKGKVIINFVDGHVIRVQGTFEDENLRHG